MSYHHAINNFCDSMLISLSVKSGPIAEHLFDEFGFLC